MSASYPSREHPHSAKELAEMASNFSYDVEVPLKYWLRTAETLLREANIYSREGNEQMAYFLLFRHFNLVAEYLLKHPDAKRQENRPAIVAMRDRLPKVMRQLEEMKPKIQEKYETYHAAARERKQRQRQRDYEYQQQQEQLFQQKQGSSKHLAQSSRSRASSSASSDHHRDSYSYGSVGSDKVSKRQSIPPSLIPGSSASASASAHASKKHFARHGWSYEPASPETPSASSQHSHRPRSSSRSTEEELFDIQKTLQNLQIHTKSPLPASLQRDLQEKVESQSPVSYSVRNGNWSGNYPSIPKRSSWQGPSPSPVPSNDEYEYVPQQVERLPALPPKVREPPPEQPQRYLDPSRPPARPAKAPWVPVPAPPSPSPSPQPPPSAFDNYEFKPVAYTEKRQPLRTIFIPEGLRTKFLQVAHPNTKSNLETCGILCGFLKQNALFVNRLVIPEQESTSDTCQTTDEASLLEYVDSEELLVLGWIHTHPTQTCFMSSVDLHTQCGYQLQLAESIAIVCAPRHEPSWGVYRLTDPPGLDAIKVCRNPGLFHPHDVDDVYTDALRPGHVCEVKEMGFRVVDLRKKNIR